LLLRKQNSVTQGNCTDKVSPGWAAQSPTNHPDGRTRWCAGVQAHLWRHKLSVATQAAA